MNSRKARSRTDQRHAAPIGGSAMTIDYRPFVFYGGNCRDAFTRYKEILGGDLVLLTFAEAPSEESVPPEQADLIIHAALTTDGAYVMGSDDPTGEFTRIQRMSVSVWVDDAEEAPRVLHALAGRRALPA